MNICIFNICNICANICLTACPSTSPHTYTHAYTNVNLDQNQAGKLCALAGIFYAWKQSKSPAVTLTN